VQFADSQAVLVGNFIHDNDHGVNVAGNLTSGWSGTSSPAACSRRWWSTIVPRLSW
jgi:hypothetical protein